MRRHRQLAPIVVATAATTPGLRPAIVQDAHRPILTRALVFRATLAGLKFVHREIEFVRATTRGAEFRSRPAALLTSGPSSASIVPGGTGGHDSRSTAS